MDAYLELRKVSCGFKAMIDFSTTILERDQSPSDTFLTSHLMCQVLLLSHYQKRYPRLEPVFRGI